MGSCAAPSAKGDDKFITTDYLQQCPAGYYQGSGVVTKLQAGEIAVAKPGQVHGAMNTDSKESFIFVSVVAPGNAGFALAEK
ncbi:hypothetical protein [Enterobacter kobei]